MERLLNKVDYLTREEDYESLDKRTKEYKEYAAWKANFQKEKTIGAGDVIEKVTKATRIKQIVKWVAGEDCGCNERKEKLNDMFQWKVAQCPTEDQFNWMKNYLENEISNKIPMHVQKKCNEILTHVYKRQFPNICSSCSYGSRMDMIKALYKAYL